MLVSSGLGSFASRRLIGGNEGRLIKALGSAALLVALLGTVLGPMLTALVGLPVALKMAIAVGLIAPLGFAMGMVVECRVERFGKRRGAGVRGLSGAGADADRGRPLLFRGAGGDRQGAHRAREGRRARPGPRHAGAVTPASSAAVTRTGENSATPAAPPAS